MSNATCGFRLLAGCGLFPSAQESMDIKKVSVPLRGVGCFNPDRLQSVAKSSFRPLAGCGLFHQHRVRSPLRRVSVPLRGVGCFRDGADRPQMVCVSVPLRGMGCFDMQMRHWEEIGSFRPLAGCGLFPAAIVPLFTESVVSVPLRGVGCFYDARHVHGGTWFPSPCGVWVVSAKLHILSGVTGKRIVNSAILLYHIGRCLSIAN